VNFFHKLSVVTRAKDWRLSFVPFIMGCVYMWLWWFKLPFTLKTISLTFLSLLTTIGFASLGYFINEFFDKESDAKAGKLNKLAFISPQLQFGICLSSIALTLLPWIWLPSNSISWLLIVLQIFLFLIYSLPFPRIKEATYLSVVIDSLYAYVVPLILSFYTFGLIADTITIPTWFYLFVVAVFFIGLRNIIIHQVNDVMKDKQSGMTTLPMVLGVENTKLVIVVILLYEVLFIMTWVLALQVEHVEMWMWIPIYLPAAFYSLRYLLSTSNINYDKLFINYTYQYFMPLLLILLLVINNVGWIFILLLHVILLIPFHLIKKSFNLLKEVISYTQRFVYNDVRNILSMVINYPIYYCFRLLGVDLKKEKVSALGILKRKFASKKI